MVIAHPAITRITAPASTCRAVMPGLRGRRPAGSDCTESVIMSQRLSLPQWCFTLRAAPTDGGLNTTPASGSGRYGLSRIDSGSVTVSGTRESW